jgi:hypothetical protein
MYFDGKTLPWPNPIASWWHARNATPGQWLLVDHLQGGKIPAR